MKKLFLFMFVLLFLFVLGLTLFAEEPVQPQPVAEQTPQQIADIAKQSVDNLVKFINGLQQENASLKSQLASNQVQLANLQQQVAEYGKQVESTQEQANLLKLQNDNLGNQVKDFQTISDQNLRYKMLLRRVLMWLEEENALREDITDSLAEEEE